MIKVTKHERLRVIFINFFFVSLGKDVADSQPCCYHVFLPIFSLYISVAFALRKDVFLCKVGEQVKKY